MIRSKLKKFKNKRINSSYLNLIKEVNLLIKLRLKKKRSKKIKHTNNALIINTCLIGDFIASLPALMYFINKHKLFIDLVVSPTVEPLAKRIKGIRYVFTARSVFNREIEKEKKNKLFGKHYDLVLVMRLSKDAGKLLKHIYYNKIQASTGPYLRYGIYLARNLRNKKTIKQWEQINFEIIGEKGIHKKRIKLDDIFSFNKDDYKRVDKLPFLKNNKRRVIIHTGSGWSVKLWSNKNWVELLKKLNNLGNLQFVFVGGTKEEQNHFDEIRKYLDFKISSVIKRVDIKEITLLMKKCDYFIGVDSGPRHIAHLVDLPSICLLGPGPKYFKPVNKKTIVIDKSNCRCTNLFCYRKKTCMEKISVDDVFEGFKKLDRFYHQK